jgi:ammonia channel protein AmtB
VSSFGAAPLSLVLSGAQTHRRTSHPKVPMSGSPIVLLLATIGITVLLAPSLALFFGGRPDARLRRVIAIAIPGSMLIATLGWMLLGATLGVAAFQGALAATAVAVILAVGLRTGSVRGYLLFCLLWLVLVIIPVGYSLFDVVHGPLATSLGTLDFGGVSILALCTGTAALALSLVSRRRGNAVGGPPKRSRTAFAVAGAGAVLGWLAVDIGAELVVDSTTLTLAANELWAALAGAAGWTVAQVINVHRATAAGFVAGLLAGSIVVLPASPWLDTTSVVVLGLVAGILGHVAAVAARRSGIGLWATLVGVCLVPGAVGLVGAGVVARGLGLVFSGHTDLLGAQLSGLTIVLAYSFTVTLLLAVIVDRGLRLTGSSRHVDETILRLYRDLNARDADAALARVHPELRWDTGESSGPVEGADAVRERWERDWAAGSPLLTPLRSRRRRQGWIEVELQQAPSGSPSTGVTRTLVHRYTERAGLFDRMELG